MYNKCSYFQCCNHTGMKSMFRFPWKDRDRLSAWLENCGNYTLARLPPKSLRGRYICIDHFKAKDVRKETGCRRRIKRTAVPMHYKDFNIEELDGSEARSQANNTLKRKEFVTATKAGKGGTPGDTQRCDACRGEVTGCVYVCVECPHRQCAACETRGAHAAHCVLRVTATTTERVVRRLVSAIQLELADIANEESGVDPTMEPEVIQPEIKTEETELGLDPLADPNTDEETRLTLFDMGIKMECDSDDGDQSTNLGDPCDLDASPTSPSASPNGLAVLKPLRVYKNKVFGQRKGAEKLLCNMATTEDNNNSSEEDRKEKEIRKRKPKRNPELDNLQLQELKDLVCATRRKLTFTLKRHRAYRRKHKDKKYVNMATYKFNSDTSKVLAKMQFRKFKSRKYWSDEEKTLSLTLYRKSGLTYSFLLKAGVILPSKSTIARWIEVEKASNNEPTPVPSVTPEERVSTPEERGSTPENSGSTPEDSGSAQMDSGSAQKDSGSAQMNSGSAQKDSGSARKASGSVRKNSGSVRKNSGSVRKNSGSSRKDSGSAKKDSGSVRKDSGSARKNSGSAQKHSGSARKDSSSAQKDSGSTLGQVDVESGLGVWVLSSVGQKVIAQQINN